MNFETRPDCNLNLKNVKFKIGQKYHLMKLSYSKGFTNLGWPTKKIKNSPIWCPVDLRDGNQALAEPMDSERKMKFFLLGKKLNFY